MHTWDLELNEKPRVLLTTVGLLTADALSPTPVVVVALTLLKPIPPR